jgi:hypothetical protein
MSPAHRARKKIIYDQLMILSRYNPKNRNHGQKSLPTWNGEYGTLHTFLLLFDEQIITEQSESQRRIWLDEKTKPYNEQFRHCTTYAAARKYLGDVMTDPETTAAQYENQLLSLKEAHTETEELEQLKAAMKYLGGAIQAYPDYRLNATNAYTLIGCVQIRKKENYLDKIRVIIKEQKVAQASSSPNLAQGIRLPARVLKHPVHHHRGHSQGPTVNRDHPHRRPCQIHWRRWWRPRPQVSPLQRRDGASPHRALELHLRPHVRHP